MNFLNFKFDISGLKDIVHFGMLCVLSTVPLSSVFLLRHSTETQQLKSCLQDAFFQDMGYVFFRIGNEDCSHEAVSLTTNKLAQITHTLPIF
jgi:hypothetical protein